MKRFSGNLMCPARCRASHEASADHISGVAIFLFPVPSFAKFDRELSSTQSRMIFDQVLDFVKVRLTVVMTTESEGSFHVDDDSIDFWTQD